MANLMQDVGPYRGAEIETDRYLVCVKVFPPQDGKTIKELPNYLEEHYQVRLLNEGSIKCLYQTRVNCQLKAHKMKPELKYM
jgi:hypothetical protein